MSLQLDARQRAMLEEMGLKLFWPQPGAIAAPALASVEAVPAARTAAVPVAEAPAAASRSAAPRQAGADPANLGWDELEAAVTQWASARRRPAVFGEGDRQPDWLCVGDPPGEDEERQGMPFVGDAGKLLDNMLAAVGASRRRGAYLTNVAKCRLSPDRAQEDEELTQGLAFLRRQVQLLQPRVILAMGRFPVQALLPGSEPLGRLRGRVHEWLGVPLVVTYHPAYLLRTPADKAKAWADLCLARSLLQGA